MMLVSADITAPDLTTASSTAAKATAAKVPTAYSAVVMPEDRSRPSRRPLARSRATTGPHVELPTDLLNEPRMPIPFRHDAPLRRRPDVPVPRVDGCRGSGNQPAVLVSLWTV
jgi:hypothetical protein